MSYFRNPEIKKELVLFGGIWAALVGIVWWYTGVEHILTAAVPGAVFCLLHFVCSYIRYRNIAQLSERVSRFLHGQTAIGFGRQKEGELAVLENEISKMVIRLQNQTELLVREKNYLADSIADISHQIRTPLTSMNLIVSRLSTQNMPPEKKKKLLLELDQLLVHMDWLIQSLLKIAKLDAGTIVMKREPVLVREMLEKAAEPLAIPMELRQQKLETISEDGVSMQGDLLWMKEAVLNIVKNCMEHTPIGGKVWITAEENVLYTEIIIKDNGTGIAKEDLPHLFERFYKGKNSSEKSVGIGLALAKMIITKQQGVVTAENIKTGGARFVIRFYKGTV